MGQVRLDDARRLIAAAEKKANEIGQPMNIAVADEGGNIVAHIRMNDALATRITLWLRLARQPSEHEFSPWRGATCP